MKLSLFLLYLTGLVPVIISIVRTIPKYELIMTQMTWPDAQKYCRVKGTDLATIQSDTDWLLLNKTTTIAGLTTPVWVGLYNDVDSWRWVLNEVPLKNVTYTNWYPGNPKIVNGKEACAILDTFGEWWDTSCTDLRPFICYNGNFSGAAQFINITSPKLSWSNAHTYCRTHYTDMASSFNSSDNNLIWQIRGTAVLSPWIGLHRGTWKWSDGSSTTNLPWASRQPDNAAGNETCAVFYNNQISDEPCTNLHYFFCHAASPMMSQTVRVQVKSDGSVFDPAVQSSILQQIEQKLKEKGMLENTTVSWKVQPDGNIFHKKKKDEL